MKEVAAILLVALLFNGCGSTKTVQSTAGGTWQAQLIGGTSTSSGFSFNAQFTVNGDGALSITEFQFLTAGACFPITGETVTGKAILQVNSNDTVTGTLSFVVQTSGNTLTLDGTVTGTAIVGAQNTSTTLTGATITGNWTLTAGGNGCVDSTGSFTMSQGTTT